MAAFKRALVVDDSKLARVALKKLLDEHDLEVSFAQSGEEALELLDREAMDVVFMDHHMPGMDGLEAVAAIKRNPKTATIPVMMYTTREGEVYVSQARALGAVGVLPKQVQPGVLFDMLVKLGLVQERRGPTEAVPEQPEEAPAFEVDRRLNDQAQGMSVQALVTRILEDQHLSLRADILRGNREFARQVATEILEEARAIPNAPEAAAVPVAPDEPTPKNRNYSQATVTALVLVLLVSALVLGGLYLQATDERDSSQARLVELDETLEERLQVAESVTSDMLTDMREERASTLEKHLVTLSWSLNEGGQHGFERLPFDARRLEQLQVLLTHLADVGFEGSVKLSSHLGEFCLNSNRLGVLSPAEPNLSATECATIGHPLDGSGFVSERQSPEFVAFMEIQSNTDPISVELVAHDRFGSTRRYPFPTEPGSAEEWNTVAARNHRVEYELSPAPGR